MRKLTVEVVTISFILIDNHSVNGMNGYRGSTTVVPRNQRSASEPISTQVNPVNAKRRNSYAPPLHVSYAARRSSYKLLTSAAATGMSTAATAGMSAAATM